MPSTYCNEIDPFASEWLTKLFPAATVDRRSIADVAAADVTGFERVHFFAGIGGWEHALRIAGWPANRPVWTGSCPCQPYSAAGKGEGDKDLRNLWPQMFRLIRECRPECIFGEQVERAVGHGWLDGICADLEREGYAVGSVVLGAHSAGAPHIRQRIYWVADAKRSARRESSVGRSDDQREAGGRDESTDRPGERRVACALANADEIGLRKVPKPRLHDVEYHLESRCEVGGMDDTICDGWRTGGNDDAGDDRFVADATIAARTVGDADVSGESAIAGVPRRTPTECIGSPWNQFDVVHCRDGKTRRIEPGSFPLAHGVPDRVGRLRGYGNAIVPQVAAAFIQAFLESESKG